MEIIFVNKEDIEKDIVSQAKGIGKSAQEKASSSNCEKPKVHSNRERE
ncbi:MAG: hypothetical protein R3Y50_04480 [Rikenellaceae bacterium]